MQRMRIIFKEKQDVIITTVLLLNTNVMISQIKQSNVLEDAKDQNIFIDLL